MVLDDLGLVPTLRRVARDRSRRAHVPVEFESLGTDRRLPMELESTVFRVADEAVAGLAGGHPDKVMLTLDWGDELEVVVRAVHPARGGRGGAATPTCRPRSGRWPTIAAPAPPPAAAWPS